MPAASVPVAVPPAWKMPGAPARAPVPASICIAIAPGYAPVVAEMPRPLTMIDSTWLVSAPEMLTCSMLPVIVALAPREPVDAAAEGVPMKLRVPGSTQAGKTPKPFASQI